MSTGVQAQAPELEEVSAKDILARIENGKNVALKNVYIPGELNLSNELIESEIKIQGSVIENVDFSNTQFNNSIDFVGANLIKTKFGGASFNHDADFREARFNNTADFGRAIFNHTYFIGADFNDTANFWNAKFKRLFSNFGMNRKI